MRFDARELELPDTIYSRDIDSSVFQAIVAECLQKVGGVRLIPESLVDSLLGMTESLPTRGVEVVQDVQKHSVNIKVTVQIAYGISIPDKAEEVQSLVAHEVTKLSGLHVASVHLVFKGVYFEEREAKEAQSREYSDLF